MLHCAPSILNPYFLKKGRLPLSQVVESFRPAIASEYKLAQANIAYRRFSFFLKPLYTTFRKPNWHFIIRNACSTLQRTEDLRFSMYRSQSIVLSLTCGRLLGRRLIRKSILEKCSLLVISGRFWTPRYPESPYTTLSSSRSNLAVSVMSCSFAAVTVMVWTRPLPASTPMRHFIPKRHSLPFLSGASPDHALFARSLWSWER